MAVIIAQISIRIIPITPGTKLYAPFICGLYSSFTSGTICSGAGVPAESSAWYAARMFDA